MNGTITHWNQSNQTFIPLHETSKYMNFITELRQLVVVKTKEMYLLQTN